ncbi:ABC transporter ATP-binding protein [Roseivirga sp. BDSF3-8]|uniref:ABC transporter ATP-binding protein n=1 Tax=Roseivirga sp. BDSF3-8 TaxID=3241598 RepID=UPI003531CFA6
MISLRNITKTYDGVCATDNLSLDIPEGELLVLLGKSGSGKTTTLKMINRLIEPDFGEILIEGQSVLNSKPELLRRKVGYVIQHTGLFPHYTVSENIGLVPGLLGWDKNRIRQRVNELLNMTGLDAGLAGRYPDALSGGQQQRVGIARALAANPPVVLLDEPFGALDPLTRRQLQKALYTLRRQEKRTMVMVTHDMTEAVMLADRICLMEQGRIQQVASPFDMIFHPTNTFVRSFFDDFRFRLELMVVKPSSLTPYLPEADVYQARGQKVQEVESVFEVLELLERSEKEGALPVMIGGVSYSLTAPDLMKAFYDWRESYRRKSDG